MIDKESNKIFEWWIRWKGEKILPERESLRKMIFSLLICWYLEKRVGEMSWRGSAVRADATTASETEDVLLVFLYDSRAWFFFFFPHCSHWRGRSRGIGWVPSPSTSVYVPCWQWIWTIRKVGVDLDASQKVTMYGEFSPFFNDSTTYVNLKF